MVNASLPSNELGSSGERAPTPEPLTARRRSWASPEVLAGLLLLLAVVLVYQSVGHAGYVWDDSVLVVKNPCVVGPLGLKEVWTTKEADLCPLTITTFWAEHKLWGLAPLPYHLVNVLLHAAGAILLWRVLLSLRVPGAWLGAALWALHPVQVESVAWIAEMKNTLSGVFFLLAVLFFLRALGSSGLDGGAGRRWLVALTWLCAAMAMASKTSAMVLPVVLCLLAWWQEGRWRWRTLLELGPVFLLALAAGSLSLWTQSTPSAAGGLAQVVRSWPQRLAVAGDVVWFYLGKLAWPHPLMIVYPLWEIDTRRWSTFLPLLAVLAVLCVLWRQRRAWRTTGGLLAGAYFLAALLPVLGLVEIRDFRHSFVFDHFQYLASMGPLALVGAGVVRVLPGRGWQSTVGAVLLLALGLTSWQRTRVYESQETLWKDTLAKNPHCWVGYENLGPALLKSGRLDEAIVQLQEGLKINPPDVLWIGCDHLGVALLQKGRVDEAIVLFQRAKQSNPADVTCYNDLGNALRRKGRLDEAFVQYQEALKIDPRVALTHNNLGVVLRQKGQVDEAIMQYQEALKIDPGNAQSYNNLGNALMQKGRVEEAITQYREAMKIDPDNAANHHNLGVILARRGRLDEAVAQLQEAVRLKPDDREAQQDLATAEVAFRSLGPR